MSARLPQQEQEPRDSTRESAVRARGSTELLAKLIQVAGVVMFFLEWSQPGPAQDSVLILCGVFVVGAEAVKNAVIQFIDRLFARDP